MMHVMTCIQIWLTQHYRKTDEMKQVSKSHCLNTHKSINSLNEYSWFKFQKYIKIEKKEIHIMILQRTTDRYQPADEDQSLYTCTAKAV